MDHITVLLKETRTFFIFDLPQLCKDAQLETVKNMTMENEYYTNVLNEIMHKVVDDETQSTQILTKTRSTCVEQQVHKNCSTFVNNWILFDLYQHHSNNNLQQIEYQQKEQKLKFDINNLEANISLTYLIRKEILENFLSVILRILTNEIYTYEQRQFSIQKGQNECNLDLCLNYRLELLWEHKHPKTCNRLVTTFCWSPNNKSLLAVGYANFNKFPIENKDKKSNGLLLIWCMKNPLQPDRFYKFNSPVSDLDWSTSRPNLLAVGFYNGVIRIIDISKKELNIVRISERKTSLSYNSQLQVQWWMAKELTNINQDIEQIYTSNQDGRICYYSINGEFKSHEILKIYSNEVTTSRVMRLHNLCTENTIPIISRPAALLLRRHPDTPNIYFVGTEEGCIHRCSINYRETYLASYQYHDGPIYSFEFSPFCSKLMLSCGADWSARIWAEGIDQPLICYVTKTACITSAAWSPKDSTLFASTVANMICIWDIKRKSHRPASITYVGGPKTRLMRLQFTKNGEQIVTADEKGTIYLLNMTGMPFPPYNGTHSLARAIEKVLCTKPELLQRVRKLGPPFN